MGEVLLPDPSAGGGGVPPAGGGGGGGPIPLSGSVKAAVIAKRGIGNLTNATNVIQGDTMTHLLTQYYLLNKQQTTTIPS